MKKIFQELAKKKWFFTAICLCAIVLVGLFLRIYNLDEWLYFQTDQSRDFNRVITAVEGGPEWLPLLGPKAGGTYLRLGPIFYYFGYISGLIFGIDSPTIMVFPDLLFSLLSIVLLFFFLKEFFSRNWSLILTAGYAVCLYGVEYSRFAWNPNSLPFFNLLFFFSIFKYFTEAVPKRKTVWAILSGIALAVASQLHFSSFLALPIALVVIILVRKFYFKNSENNNFLKLIWLVFLMILIIYIPPILSDIATQGNNTINFLASLGSKGSAFEFFFLLERDTVFISKFTALVTTGLFDISSEWMFLAVLFFITSLSAGIYFFKKETDKKRKFFLILIFIWLLAYFIMFFPMGKKLSARFFLPILPVAFVLWGIIGLVLKKIKFKFINIFVIIFLFIPFLSNLYSVKVRFSEIRDSQIKYSQPRKAAFSKALGGESWWHLVEPSRFMSSDCEKEKILIVPMQEKFGPLYKYSFRDIKEMRSFQAREDFSYDENTCYYIVYSSKRKFLEEPTLLAKKIKEKSFGVITVARFEINPETKEVLMLEKPKGEVAISTKKEIKDKKAAKAKEKEIEDAIGPENADADIQEEEIEEENSNSLKESIMKNAIRKDRIFWKDLFEQN